MTLDDEVESEQFRQKRAEAIVDLVGGALCCAVGIGTLVLGVYAMTSQHDGYLGNGSGIAVGLLGGAANVIGALTIANSVKRLYDLNTYHD